MQLHRLEKIWLIFGVSMLFLFLIVLGVSTFVMGMEPPNSHQLESFDPAKVSETAPFNEPVLKKIGENEYEAVMVAYAFGYSPDKLEVPAGSTVHFKVTSSDVVHGFEIPGTNANMMVVPGEVNHVSHQFDEPGEYLIICNEYCGTAHEFMSTTIVVN
ncbi:cytochrome c oxidase subunit II [Chengkuizengella axinellae]|uniref:Cytochrome aa3 subunit 2 n=1 Tax=Chengkuizengella axinellae TaxID=3064388 RepID=A0ABT9IZT0_9BACL|nr:cytochrome c oxidase subunit II [Chengkuizengella sp. 2205SS18-9]MDP5274868.1 cytochrome c oxidase subunit II [Chengkuizengella sp. 2205SS18-9]